MHCSKPAFLFDHLVGAAGQGQRDERLGRLEIDDELKLGWLSTKNHECACVVAPERPDTVRVLRELR